MESFSHKPVMVEQVLAALNPHARGTYADGTLGRGGHAEAILRASVPDGRLYGCDRDGEAVTEVKERLSAFAGRYELRRGTFRQLGEWVELASCDGVLLDLGVSSPQLDSAARGFSFQQDGPLDMRMDDRQSLTAANLVNEASVEDLAELFFELGGEREGMRIARAIEHERIGRPIERTSQLAGLIARVSPRRGSRIHPATRVFQALRLAVNNELEELAKGLEAIWMLLKPGGLLAVITFHSLEDQVVKRFGREKAREYTFPGSVDVPELRQPRDPTARWVKRKAIVPDAKELRENPRSRSAQLRILERIK